MALKIGDNFSYLGAKPLDARRVFASKAALDAINLSTVYEGMVVYAQLEDKYYRLKSGVWVEFSSGISTWTANTVYAVNDIVIDSSNLYICTTAHTSGSSFDSTEQANWNKVGGGDASINNWASGATYTTGTIVIYGNTLYKCNTNHTGSGTFGADEANWDSINAYIPSWTASTYYKIGATVLNNNKLYICTTAHTSTITFSATSWTQIGGGGAGIIDWASTKDYAVEDIVYYSKSLFKCNTAHTSGSAFNADESKWTLMYADIKLWQSSLYYVVGAIVLESNVLYRCNTSHTSGSIFNATEQANWDVIGEPSLILEWTANTSYSVNDIAIYNGDLYKCVTAHISGSTFDAIEELNWSLLGRPNIDDWATSYNYQVDDMVIYANSIYRCIAQHTSNNTNFSADVTNWELVYADLKEWVSGDYYTLGTCVIDSDRYIWRCTTTHTAGLNFDATEKANWEMIGGDPDSLTSAQVAALVANFNPAGDGLMQLDNWEASHGYTVKQVVLYNNKMYRCKTAHTSGSTFDATEKANWDEIVGSGSGASINAWTSGGNYAVGDFVIYHNKIYQCKTANADTTFTPANWQEIGGIADYASGISYMVGELVFNNTDLCRCKVAHTSTATFDASKWDIIGGSASIDAWASSKSYAVGDIIIRENNLYRCNTAHTSSSAFNTDIANWTKLDNIPNWNINTYYAVGDYLYYDKNLYKVITAFTSSTTFNDTNLEMLGGVPLSSTDVTNVINNFDPVVFAYNTTKEMYTSTERAVGIWVDGKTIYQKTVNVVLPSSSSSQAYSYMPSIPWGNIDTLINIDGFVNRSDGWYVKYGVTFYSSTGTILKLYINWNKSSSQIYFFVDSNTPGTAGQTATLTFKYTKV